jgi:hypothetical protein
MGAILLAVNGLDNAIEFVGQIAALNKTAWKPTQLRLFE